MEKSYYEQFKHSALLFQKGEAPVVDSFYTWNILCTKVPFPVGGKVKDLSKFDWKDEHGEDVYLPQKAMFEAYDMNVEMAYQGQELISDHFNLTQALTTIENFKRWLSGNDTDRGSGTELKMFSPYIGKGVKCYLSEINDEEPHLHVKGVGSNDYQETVVTFKVKFRVIDPMLDTGVLTFDFPGV